MKSHTQPIRRDMFPDRVQPIIDAVEADIGADGLYAVLITSMVQVKQHGMLVRLLHTFTIPEQEVIKLLDDFTTVDVVVCKSIAIKLSDPDKVLDWAAKLTTETLVGGDIPWQQQTMH